MPPRVAFVFLSARAELAAEIAAGRAPDSALHGLTHLRQLGVDAFAYDPQLTRRSLPEPFWRLAWVLREVVTPWELHGVDAVVTSLGTLFPLATRWRRGPPVVVLNYALCTKWAHSTAARRRLLGASLRSAATVVCLGDSQTTLTRELTGARAVTVPLGTDERYWSPGEPPAGARCVLAVGRDPARDYHTLAEALRGLDAPAEVVARPANVAGVRFPDRVRTQLDGRADLRELYARASCVVLAQHPDGYPSGSEASGLTALLEAWAMSRPVVATDRAIVRDYVDADRTGVIVPPRDPAALRAAINRILGDDDLAARLGAAGREQVEREHTTRRFAERLAPLILAAAGRSGSIGD